MKRIAFDTGQPHQARVAAWARRRLVDGQGKQFDDGHDEERPDQWGCLLADGVGLGKTWEALAATALILAKGTLWRHDGSRRERRRRQRAHVLILTPPALVSKWTRELRSATGFSRRLEKWARQTTGRGFVRRTFAQCFELRRRTDSDDLPSGKVRRGRYSLPAGTYVCNWNVFLGKPRPGRDRVTALRRQEWDVIIVDEAHHARAREALDTIRWWVRVLLLSATPFQLDPTELHVLTRHVVNAEAAHQILSRGVVREYVKAVDRYFETPGSEPPARAQRRDAERVLGQLIARSPVADGRRRHYTIDGTGLARPISDPATLGPSGVGDVLARSIDPGDEFEGWYLRRRLALAARETKDPPPHVAVELRKWLSTTRRACSPVSPRLVALRRWAERQLVEDLRAAAADGMPRKLLVFTHFVDKAADELRGVLGEAFARAYATVGRDPAWRAMRAAAPAALERTLTRLGELAEAAGNTKVPDLLGRLRRQIESTPFFDLFGKRAFAKRAEDELRSRLADLGVTDATEDDDDDDDDDDERTSRWVEKQRRLQRKAAAQTLRAISEAPIVATYTGGDDRAEREANGEAFRTPLAPWILVASNVGSEGIDLHTYGRHLVHFDLEWNPAKMEQREGRIDRLGRELKEPVSIYYLLVRGSYDERMFHQLVARQRWHGVLLGRTANRMVNREADARMIEAGEAARIALDLRPRQGR